MLKRWKNSRWFKIVSSKYFLTGVPFLVWMLFFDDNSWLLQRELNQEMDKLEESIEFYQTELEYDRVELKELESNPAAFEKYAREKFWMHRPGEEVYVFEFVEE
jgi:cell division protein DivIC